MILRGRDFSESELDLIKETISQNQKLSRRHLSLLICEKLSWKQPNGKLKDRACRDVLLRLEKKGIIELPEPRYNFEEQNITIKPIDFLVPQNEISGILNNFDISSLRLKLVKDAHEREI